MTRDESRDVWLTYRCASWMRAHPVSAFGGERYVPHSQLESAERERDAALARVRELERELRDEEERHSALQSRCYEGFPTATDGIFDALNELEPIEKAYREIGEEWESLNNHVQQIVVATGAYQLTELLDRAAAFAKKEGTNG